VLVICVSVSACHKIEYTNASFNETCWEMGYDYAVPVYVDDEVAGFNCCVEITENTYNCEDFYYLDDVA